MSCKSAMQDKASISSPPSPLFIEKLAGVEMGGLRNEMVSDFAFYLAKRAQS